MIFFDTTYLVRLDLDELGADTVRELAKAQPIVASWHAQAELLCTFHRAFREGRLDPEAYQALRAQYHSDKSAAAFKWLPISEPTLVRLDQMLTNAPATSFLRAANALHLACTAEHGFKLAHSNDRHFLAAAPLFGLEGINHIGETSIGAPPGVGFPVRARATPLSSSGWPGILATIITFGLPAGLPFYGRWSR